MEEQKSVQPASGASNETTNTGSEKIKKKFKEGRWNLLILGIFSIAVAIATTGISLLIYHNSGDIYLDRSRPGYLPDEGEIESEVEKDTNYKIDKSGKMSMEVLEEYLENLDAEIREIDSFEKPFEQDVLSDERLGIPAE